MGTLYVLNDLILGHVIVIGLMMFLYYFNVRTRRFLSYAWPMICAPLLYDLLRYQYHNFITGSVHVEEPYLFEKTWFGVMTQLGKVTLNEYFSIHNHVVLDFICGVIYLTFLFQPVAVFFYTYFKRHLSAARILALSFFLVNLIGYIIYFIYPAAPPWYVADYGLGPANMQALPSAAGAHRFDEMMGVPFFAKFYSNSNDVFGAIPSLHVAYPLQVFFISLMIGKLRVFSFVYLCLMIFSAIYLQHHYVIDIGLGLAFALMTFIPVWLWVKLRSRELDMLGSDNGIFV